MRKLALSDEILMKIENPVRYIGGEIMSLIISQARGNIISKIH